jgi:hypothetical protein
LTVYCFIIFLAGTKKCWNLFLKVRICYLYPLACQPQYSFLGVESILRILDAAAPLIFWRVLNKCHFLQRGPSVNNTGLLKMFVGVLTTCHTQYTWDMSIYIFLFNRTTLQVFVTYLTGALYVHPLWFYTHQHDNWVRSTQNAFSLPFAAILVICAPSGEMHNYCTPHIIKKKTLRISWSIGETTYSYLKAIVYDKLLKPRQSFLITLYISLINLIVLIFSIVVFHSFLSSYWTKRLRLLLMQRFHQKSKPHAKICRQYKNVIFRSRIKSWQRRLIQDVLKRISVTNWNWQTYAKLVTRNFVICSLRTYVYGHKRNKYEKITQKKTRRN